MNSVKSYRDLKVWQRGMHLAEKVYATTQTFPKEELYAMTSQLRRAAISIPSNIAEGSARRGTKEFIRFINIACGSLAELETQLILTHRLHYITASTHDEYMKTIEELTKMLHALHRSLTDKSTP